MNPLKNFLEKFSHLMVGSKMIKDAARSVIASQTSLKLQEHEVEMKDGVVIVKVHSASKNALFMRKKRILDELKKILGAKAPHDIR